MTQSECKTRCSAISESVDLVQILLRRLERRVARKRDGRPLGAVSVIHRTRLGFHLINSEFCNMIRSVKQLNIENLVLIIYK